MIREALGESVITLAIIVGTSTYVISFCWLFNKLFNNLENSYLKGMAVSILCGLYLAIAVFVLSILEVHYG